MASRAETRRTKIFNIRFYPYEYEALKEVARIENLTMADFIRRAAIFKQREYKQVGFITKEC